MLVNAKRIQPRRVPAGDILPIGRTVIEYRSPEGGSTVVTSAGSFIPIVGNPTSTQRKILIAVCRPSQEWRRDVTPARYNETPRKVSLGVDAGKNHLWLRFQRFEIAHLLRSKKHASLVEYAFQWRAPLGERAVGLACPVRLRNLMRGA
jgi:hypothetical protein